MERKRGNENCRREEIENNSRWVEVRKELYCQGSGTRWTGQVGCRVGLDALAKRQPWSYLESNLSRVGTVKFPLMLKAVKLFSFEFASPHVFVSSSRISPSMIVRDPPLFHFCVHTFFCFFDTAQSICLCLSLYIFNVIISAVSNICFVFYPHLLSFDCLGQNWPL